MTGNFDDELKKLESELGNKLSELRDVTPEPGFQGRLWKDLESSYDNYENTGTQNKYINKKSNSKKRRKNIFLKFAIAAASIMLISTMVLSVFNKSQNDAAKIGSLFFPVVEASASGGGGFTLPLDGGISTLRRVDFKLEKELPQMPTQGKLFKLKNNETTTENALNLAKTLGMEAPKVFNDQPQTIYEPISIVSASERLVIWLNQGTWYYELDGDIVDLNNPISEKEATDIAINWLNKAKLLPNEDFDVIVKTDPDTKMNAVKLLPKSLTENKKLIGPGQEINVSVNCEGKVVFVDWDFRPLEDSLEVPLASYDEAISALKRGEGSFEAKNFMYGEGIALIEKAEVAYQLAYTIDCTAYLVPSAVFYGKYTSNEGTTENFTAYVPIIKKSEIKNSGNFSLETKLLPPYKKAVGNIKEREQGITKSELAKLASFFGIEIETIDETDGTQISGKNGEELHYTSYDYGWLYRGNQELKDKKGTISSKEAIKIASEIANKIPVLPGKPGEPKLIQTGAEDELYTVVFPLTYEQVPVIGLGNTGFTSYMAISLWKNGQLWSVDCVLPMDVTDEKFELITPEKAWENVLNNDYVISIKGLFGYMPGKGYAAKESEITNVELVYIPTHPELCRSKEYDIMYRFSGTAKVGNKEINFSAFVDATK
jgi:hypothetical protein